MADIFTLSYQPLFGREIISISCPASILQLKSEGHCIAIGLRSIRNCSHCHKSHQYLSHGYESY